MTHLRHPSIPHPALRCAAVLVVLVLPIASWAEQSDLSYGFVRIIEGRADLMQASSDTLIELVENYPLMVGDEIRVPYGSRVETVLPDGTYLRVAGDSELSFQRLALSADTEDRISVLRLLRGEVQLVLPNDTAEVEAFRVDTINASVYLHKRGTYRIRTDGTGWSEAVVREGFAEVVTEQGSTIVRSAEQTTIEGHTTPQIRVSRAGVRDDLERWGDDLLSKVSPSDSRYVEPSLAYASAPLARSGHWVSVSGRSAWRPYVGAGWRPYHDGWWMHTPSGLTWVSTEPWGWVTYHYGGWDFAPGWGWVWYPGPVYTPASVFWYWGPTYVGWVPRPYYTHYYWPRHYPSWGFGFRFNVFGWAGGSPHHWARWTFCQHRHFGRHRGPHARPHGGHYYTGVQLANSGAFKEVPRGVIASDTRALTPDLWTRPTEAMNVLAASRVDASGRKVRGELPDVTAWVARSRSLPHLVEQAVRPRTGGGLSAGGRTSPAAGSMKARRSTTVLPPARSAAGTQEIGKSVSSPRISSSVPTQSSRLGSSSSSSSRTVSTSARSRSSAVGDGADWRNRRSLQSGATSTSRTPTSRRVWDGVRSYRERSRRDSTSSIQPTYRSPAGGLGSSPGYGASPGPKTWTTSPSTSRRYFGGFGSTPGYGGTRSQSYRSRPPVSRSYPNGVGSSPGYGRSRAPGIRSGSGSSRSGGLSSSSIRSRAGGSSRPSGSRSVAGGRTQSSGSNRGSSSRPPR